MSWSEPSPQTPGAHRRHRSPGKSADARRRRPHGTLPQQPPAHYEPHLDGLFTYCLSVLCEHDAAAAALGDVLCLAERQRGRLRDPDLRRPWLYALARWVCLRRLAEGRPPTPSPQTAREVAARRERELASLAWPEAAGTTPEQREALELAVRHQLKAREVAHVLGIEADEARTLLARAACEVERTRSALAVVELGRCPAVSRLAGDSRALLGAALRQELVRHVDECPQCRVTAERAVAGGPWPGLATTAASAVLAVAEAPRSAAYAGLLHAMGTGTGRGRPATPRFDRRGFPAFPTTFKDPNAPKTSADRAARRERLRNRAVTSTVVAAVVAAPVLALWAAYGGAPLAAGGREDSSTFAAAEQDRDGADDGPHDHAYDRTADARSVRSAYPGHTGHAADGSRSPAAASVGSSTGDGTRDRTTGGASPTAGRLAVTARSRGDATYVTLTSTGGSPVRWSVGTLADWLTLSRHSGVLRPGQPTTVVVAVDHHAEPEQPWQAQIRFRRADSPTAIPVTIRGDGTSTSGSPSAEPDPRPTTGSPSPSPPATGSPSPPATRSPSPAPSGSPS